MSGPRPCDVGISNSPPTSDEKTRKCFMNQANPDYDSPAPLFFSAGLSTSHTIRRPEPTVLPKTTVFVRGLQKPLQSLPLLPLRMS